MKSLILFLIILSTLPVLAQEQTLIGADDVEHGGYGALVIKFTSVNDDFGVLLGGRGGWIINHTFSIGAAGYGLANNVRAHSPGPFGQEFVDFGYGGLDLEYISNSDNLIHLSIHALVGAGAVGFRYGFGNNDNDWDNVFDHNDAHQYDAFFVVEPGINVDLNITGWFRVSLGAEYRYIGGVSSGATTNANLRGPSGMLTFRFGKF
ncbi:MAG TPA: hypothetical protein VIL52_05550 [Bacteroidota bacterium]